MDSLFTGIYPYIGRDMDSTVGSSCWNPTTMVAERIVIIGGHGRVCASP